MTHRSRQVSLSSLVILGFLCQAISVSPVMQTNSITQSMKAQMFRTGKREKIPSYTLHWSYGIQDIPASTSLKSSIVLYLQLRVIHWKAANASRVVSLRLVLPYSCSEVV